MSDGSEQVSEVVPAVGEPGSMDAHRRGAAEVLESASSALQAAAERMPDERLSRMTRSAAQSLGRMSGYVASHEFRQITSDLAAVIKRNPVPSVIILFSLGFLTGRALRRN